MKENSFFQNFIFQIKQIEQLEKDSTLKKNDGPLVKNLDKVLNSLHVQRSAYHGRAFVGNHVNKMLKVLNLQIKLKSFKLPFRLFDVVQLQRKSVELFHKSLDILKSRFLYL